MSSEHFPAPALGRSKSLFPLILLVLGLALIGGAVVMIVLISQPPAAAAQTLVQTLDSPEPGIWRVTLQGAKDAYDRKNAVFLDVRDAQFYAEAHIPGAVSIPYNQIAERLDELDANDWIIPYCT